MTKRTGKEVMKGIVSVVKDTQAQGIKKDNATIANIQEDVKKIIEKGALRIKVFKDD